MPVPHFEKSRDKNEAEIVHALTKAGATVVRIDTPCDLIVGYHGQTFLIEIKSRNGRLTKSQREWWNSPWEGKRAVVRSAEDALMFIGAYHPKEYYK